MELITSWFNKLDDKFLHELGINILANIIVGVFVWVFFRKYFVK
jgi:hypothetical protein